jgi:hypothetical protein
MFGNRVIEQKTPTKILFIIHPQGSPLLLRIAFVPYFIALPGEVLSITVYLFYNFILRGIFPLW